MKVCVIVVCGLLPLVANAAGRDPRVGVAGATIGRVNADRALVASKNQINMQHTMNLADGMSPSTKAEVVTVVAAPVEDKKDMRDAERRACLGGNIGIGNTFVWASKYSNSGSYATMIEDTERPENNVCFVKVDLKSSDARINLTDVPGRYFIWGDTINCGSWADENILTQRILDGKKRGRTLATVGGAAGGAAVGVGAMELFGNKLIDGKVQGQKNTKLSKTEVLRSQMLVLKQNDNAKFTEIQGYLQELKAACENITEKPAKCSEYNYDQLLTL